ncbi:SURP and G-patch domain-containing protein 1-like [Clytia hemisphaerica]|uniref:SURP and G-patch domain-containing protein 1-like n=1 Tax=Clytia hemisphaerica TaxID=252671 RepID=UPI0034D64221
MYLTYFWVFREKALELTDSARGKHHLSDFLPPDELEKFLEKVKAVKEGREVDFSDYAKYKIKEENVGYQMLMKAGWQEGSGLGSKGEGITAPINKGKTSFDNGGIGTEKVAEVKKEDDDFEVYRKRMMLAYKFRPNPLNNPRRPYYE